MQYLTHELDTAVLKNIKNHASPVDDLGDANEANGRKATDHGRDSSRAPIISPYLDRTRSLTRTSGDEISKQAEKDAGSTYHSAFAARDSHDSYRQSTSFDLAVGPVFMGNRGESPEHSQAVDEGGRTENEDDEKLDWVGYIQLIVFRAFGGLMNRRHILFHLIPTLSGVLGLALAISWANNINLIRRLRRLLSSTLP